MTRDDFVALARELEGLGAAPETKAAYLDLIAPVETHGMREAMSSLSGCGLVTRGLWRRCGIVHPRLESPYVIGHAMSDLLSIAAEARAATAGLSRWPEPGDAVIVGGGPDGGGPEHVFTVLEVDDADNDITALDGGQRDAQGHQVVRVRHHVIADGADRAHDANEPGGGLPRRVRWVLNIEKILERFAQ